ncbi:unnamed protein product [Rotaria magnacalcarata]|uniref:Uncharacterized protein n=1 Tax=Rotaria magnacalcarata TaxID=392030 RepID=A0A816T3I6_9BILA|nr:unnamed protein product [Rotaria magnacalcarata]CAF2096115.1 unnamed protein product [Rotaria magnacalcarata]
MYTNLYRDTSTRNSNCFNSITDLQLLERTLRKGLYYSFSKLDSLRLQNSFYCDGILDDFQDVKQDILSLKILVNLSDLKHLDIGIGTTCRIESSMTLLKIFKDAPQLSSLRIDANVLLASIYNGELCEYYNKIRCYQK